MESTMPQEVPSVKSQFRTRFLAAKQVLGKDWRRQLADFEPHFNTRDGVADMESVAAAVNDIERRGRVERLKRVVMTMEKVAGIPHAMIL